MVVVVKHPRIDGHLVDESDAEDNDDDVIVQSPAKSSTEEEVIQNEQGADDGRDEKDEVEPESDIVGYG